MSFDPDNEQAFTAQAPSKNYGRFYRRWIRNNYLSQKEGHEVGEYQDYVIIISPGAPKTEVNMRATDEHKREFNEQWQAYLANKEQIASGTPITLLPGMDENRAAGFKAIYCMTIEQLAELSDVGVQRAGMGAAEWVQKAKKYLASNGAKEAELVAARNRIAELEDRIARLEESMKPKRRKAA